MIGAWTGLLLAALIVGVIVASFRHNVVRMYNARDLLARGAVLVDVDTAEEFAHQHPRASISVPLEILIGTKRSMGGKRRSLVVFSHSWWRGVRASRALRRMGFVNVFNVAGVHPKEELSSRKAQTWIARHYAELELEKI